MAEPRDPIVHKRLVHGARFRTLPLNVRCRARCAFCYESRVAEVLPRVRTEYIPRYDEARFDAFRRMHSRALQWETDTGRDPAFATLPTFERTPRGMAHFPCCDVFSAGLSHGQIEELVRMRDGDVCLLYTVGLDMDPDFIAHLTNTYPQTFRLHLSIVTFDPTIRQQLMHPDIDVDALRRVCSLTQGATFFVMLFSEEQLAADVDQILSGTSPANGGLFLHKLYYDRRSPQRVVDYASHAEQCRKAAVRRVARLAHDARPIMCSLGGDIQAYTRRFEIYSMLASCTGQADEAILCSPGAFPVIDQFCRRVPSPVVPLAGAFGGNVDLVQGLTARAAIEAIEVIRSGGRTLRRVLLPDGMFWIEGGYDVNGDQVGAIAERFADLEIVVLPVPQPVICSVVELGDCVAFFDDPDHAKFETPIATSTRSRAEQARP